MIVDYVHEYQTIKLPLLEAIDRVHPDALVLYDRDVAPAIDRPIRLVIRRRHHPIDAASGRPLVQMYGELVLDELERPCFFRLVEAAGLRWICVRDHTGTVTDEFRRVYGW